MPKRGQITIFIILGIIILGVLAAALFYKSEFSKSLKQNQPNEQQSIEQPVRLFIESCLKNTAEKALFENGRSGGYFILPLLSTTNLYEDVPFYYKNKQNLVPSNDLLAKETTKYLDNLLNGCLDDFTAFKERGYKITAKESSSNIILSPSVKINTFMPVSIKGENFVKELEQFNAEISKVEFYPALLTAKKLVETINNDQICLTCFADLAAENNLFVNILSINKTVQLIDIVDNDYTFNGEKFHLRFAVENEN